MATAVVSAVAPIAIDVASGVAAEAANVYVAADPGTKTAIATGLTAAGQGLGSLINLPVMIVSAIVNFIILSFIFILTLYYRGLGRFNAGVAGNENYVRDAFLRGFGFALLATVTLFIVDFLSGGFASLMMIPVYIFTGIGTLILSIIKPAFLNDIVGTVDGEAVARGSAFRYFSVVFWPFFILAMLIALGLAALTTYLGSKFSRGALDLIAGAVVRRGEGGVASSLRGLLGSATKV